jgi:hypothetical protein
VILAIHNFCYFNLVVSLLHFNHHYHADFDICHNLHCLIIAEYVPHLPVEVSSYIVSLRHAPLYTLDDIVGTSAQQIKYNIATAMTRKERKRKHEKPTQSSCMPRHFAHLYFRIMLFSGARPTQAPHDVLQHRPLLC